MSAEPAEFSACGVCGRTILRGERIAEYVTRDGERVGVCQLCAEDAEAAGWVRSDVAAERGPERPRRSPAAFIREHLGHIKGGGPAADEGEGEAVPASRGPEPAGAPAPEPAPVTEPPPVPEPKAPPPEPPAQRTPEELIGRGVERFNASGEPHKIAGLIKSLGAPEASVRLGPDGQEVLVVVAWELSWYRWGADPDGAVRQLAHGDELEELEEADRRWNAVAEEDGRLRVETGP